MPVVSRQQRFICWCYRFVLLVNVTPRGSRQQNKRSKRFGPGNGKKTKGPMSQRILNLITSVTDINWNWRDI